MGLGGGGAGCKAQRLGLMFKVEVTGFVLGSENSARSLGILRKRS